MGTYNELIRRLDALEKRVADLDRQLNRITGADRKSKVQTSKNK